MAHVTVHHAHVVVTPRHEVLHDELTRVARVKDAPQRLLEHGPPVKDECLLLALEGVLTKVEGIGRLQGNGIGEGQLSYLVPRTKRDGLWVGHLCALAEPVEARLVIELDKSSRPRAYGHVATIKLILVLRE